jgi:hypothetical protein
LRHNLGSQRKIPKINQTRFKLYYENNNGKVTAGNRSYVSISQVFAWTLGGIKEARHCRVLRRARPVDALIPGEATGVEISTETLRRGSSFGERTSQLSRLNCQMIRRQRQGSWVLKESFIATYDPA